MKETSLPKPGLPASRLSGVDLGSGPVGPALFKLAGPVMLSLFFENLFYLADTLFVSWLGTNSLAVLSLSVPLFYTAFALAKGVCAGTTVLISHALGEGRSEGARQIARGAFPLMLLVMLPWLALTLRQPCDSVFTLLGASREVLHEGHQYLFWLVLSFPVMGYFMVAEAVCMSHGDSVTPMKCLLIGNAISVCLKYLFIWKLGMGVAGSSLGTFMGWGIASLLIARGLAGQGRPLPSLAFSRETFSCWKGIAGLGSQTALGVIISPLALGFINLIMARMDLAGVAALNLAMRLEFMVIIPLVGLSNALAPFMGFNLGRGDMARIREGVRASLRLGLVVILPVMALFLLCAGPLFWIFKPSEEVQRLAEYALKCSALGYMVIPLEMTLQGTALGLRRPKYAVLAIAFRQLVLRVPLVAVLSGLYGIQGVFWGLPVSMWISGGVCLWLTRRLLVQTEDSMAKNANLIRN